MPRSHGKPGGNESRGFGISLEHGGLGPAGAVLVYAQDVLKESPVIYEPFPNFARRIITSRSAAEKSGILKPRPRPKGLLT